MTKISDFAYIYEHDLDEGSEEYQFLVNVARTIGAVMEKKVSVDAFKKDGGIEVTFVVTKLGIQQRIFYSSYLINNALGDYKSMNRVYETTHEQIRNVLWNMIR